MASPFTAGDLLPQMSEYYDPHLLHKMVLHMKTNNTEYVSDSSSASAAAGKEGTPADAAAALVGKPLPGYGFEQGGLDAVYEQVKLATEIKIVGREEEDKMINIEKKTMELKEKVDPLLMIAEIPQTFAELQKCASIQAMQDAVFHVPKYAPQAGAEAVAGEGQPAPAQQPQTFEEIRGVSKEAFDALYEYIFCQFRQGNYGMCIDLLVVYNQQLKILEKDPEAEVTYDKQLSVKWGLLACYILEQKWEQAAFAAVLLDQIIDEQAQTLSMSSSGFGLLGAADGPENAGTGAASGAASRNGKKGEVLKQRAMLVHWLLFIIFKVDPCKSEHPQISKAIEMFISEKYLTLMSFYCPHVLRYAAAAFVLNLSLKDKIRGLKDDVMHVLKNEKLRYSDPVTSFLLALYVDMDFDLAKTYLLEAKEEIFRRDYFLKDRTHEFVQNARISIFETYCKIHQSVEIATIGDKMAMSVEEAEAWIVEKMRTGKLERATISFNSTTDGSGSASGGSVSFERKNLGGFNDYSHVMNKTANTSYRLFMLQVNAGDVVNKKDPASLTQISPDIAEHLSN